MVETPLTFLKVKNKFVVANSFKFRESGLGKVPEAFDAVDMIAATSKLIFMMEDTVMAVATGN